MTSRREILEAAIAATDDRGIDYGTPADNFARIARRWRAHLMNRFGVDVPIDGVSVAIMCDDIKSARLEHDPAHSDSWIDKAGYSACGAEIALSNQAASPGGGGGREVASQD